MRRACQGENAGKTKACSKQSEPPINWIVSQIYANWDAVANTVIVKAIDLTDSEVPA
jgi:hypothetical protein